MARKGGPGRRPLKAPSRYFRLNLRLRPGEDDDLIEFFSLIPLRRRAGALKAALRAGGMSAGMAQTEGVDDDADMAAGFLE